MDSAQILKDHREEIIALAARHGASNVRVFGSIARGTATNQSDIDLLIDLARGRTLRDHVRLKQELEALLGRKVDVATANGLKSRFREQVLKEAIPL